MMNSFKVKKEKGITLIALVITIIVMLILVAVTVSTAINGSLFEYAKTAKTETIDKTQEEQSWANVGSNLSTGELIAKYTNNTDNQVNWEEALANATRHPSQSIENTDIGIGTDGKPVNLDLWTYEEEESLGDLTYVIGWKLSQDDRELGIIHGYQNDNIVNGRIQGTVPQYIKRGEGDFLPVLNLSSTFSECTSLIYAPRIPDSTTDMSSTFNNCTNLTEAPIIPNSVKFLEFAFYNCINLTTVYNLPSSAFNMNSTFDGCTSLTTVPNLPNGVKKMNNTFMNCTNLTTVPNLPNALETMSCAFKNCTSLTEVPNIPISAEQLERAFSGCTSLTVVPNIWTRVTTDTTTYKGIPNGNGCFEGCTNASNYSEIPNYWKVYDDPFGRL